MGHRRADEGPDRGEVDYPTGERRRQLTQLRLDLGRGLTGTRHEPIDEPGVQEQPEVVADVEDLGDEGKVLGPHRGGARLPSLVVRVGRADRRILGLELRLLAQGPQDRREGVDRVLHVPPSVTDSRKFRDCNYSRVITTRGDSPSPPAASGVP